VRIDTLSSTNFRNLASESLTFSPGVNILVGDNGQGKTNILEAIYIFKFGRSFRTSKDGDMVRFGENFCRVEVSTSTENDDRERYELTIEHGGGKQVKVSGKTVVRFSELVGKYPCVLFGPQDIDLVSGSPGERRRFIDMAGSMTDGTHIDVLRDYKRVLQQRNAAFKQRRTPAERKVWDGELIAKGTALADKRSKVVDAIEQHVKQYDGALETPFGFRMQYLRSFVDGSMQAANTEEAFAMKLAAMEDEEMRRGITLVGPHRDDMRLLIDNIELKRYGSQGQKRLLAVILKLAEMSYLEEGLSELCVLLLDDVFSEFDETIGVELKQLLGNRRQVFVSSPVPLEWETAPSSKVFHITNGETTS
jgi:DNA replication and repair protein RecF